MKLRITTERGLQMVETIQSLRNRKRAVELNLQYYGEGLAQELKVKATPDEMLSGLDMQKRTVTLEDKPEPADEAG